MSLRPLPSPSRRPGKQIQRLIVAFLLVRLDGAPHVRLSQREFAAMFNRVGSSKMSVHLRELCRAGWLSLEVESSGLAAHGYGVGPIFKRDRQLFDDWSELSSGLYGNDGLLTDSLGSPGWGHGCLGITGMLCLATLRKSSEPIRQKDFVSFLSPLCTEGTVRRWLRTLAECDVAARTADGFALHREWAAKLEELFDDLPQCQERLNMATARRKKEQDENRLTVTQNEMTDAEKGRLRKLPCVLGCGRRALQMEHFPPKRYLEHLPVHTNRYLVWAICWRCNNGMSAFIKSLPDIDPEVTKERWTADSADPLALYAASANFHLKRFYEAAKREDSAAAVEAIRNTLTYWHTLYVNGYTVNLDRTGPPRPPGNRRKGPDARLTSWSQLPVPTDPKIEAKRKAREQSRRWSGHRVRRLHRNNLNPFFKVLSTHPEPTSSVGSN